MSARHLAFASLAILTFTSGSTAQLITTVAGGGPDNVPALSANLGEPYDVLVAPSGDVYIADAELSRIVRVNASGQLTLVAGVGVDGFSFLDDGDLATKAHLNTPRGIALDGAGNLFIADTNNHRIRRVDATTGIITTVAGALQSPGFCCDGGLATSAWLGSPFDVAVDTGGNLFIADTVNHRIRRVDAITGIITTVAGTGTAGFSGDGGLATAAFLKFPTRVALDTADSLYIADRANNRIRRVDATTGVITTVAGDGTTMFGGDFGPATSASLFDPGGVSVDPSGNLFIADTFHHRVRRVDAATGIITTVAGSSGSGFSGDGGLATNARLSSPVSVAVDNAGDLFVADRNNRRVRRVDDSTEIIDTLAGNGTLGFSGDGGPATSASILQPTDVALDAAGSLFIADESNHRVRRVDAGTGVITTVAGNAASFSGDGGLAVNANVQNPRGVFLDGAGNLFIADSRNHRVRRVDAVTDIITTVAGGGGPGLGDGGPATSARLREPSDVAVDSDGNLFIADRLSHRVRRVDAVTSIITTVAGNGIAGFTGDHVLATATSLFEPWDVALDSAGNLFVSDSRNYRVRRVDAATGVITTVAGTGLFAFSGDGALAVDSGLRYPQGIALDTDGNLFIAESSGSRIRRVDAATGIITTVAGQNSSGFSGDGGPATSARLDRPSGVTVASDGDFFVADSANNRIRQVSTPQISPTTLSVAPVSVTYGATASPSATLTSGGSPVVGVMVSFSLNGVGAGSGVTDSSGVATLFAASVAGIDAGTFPAGISAEFPGDDDFSASTGTAALTVTPAALTVSADDQSRTYGAANPPLTGTLTGVVAGDAITATYATTATAASPVGTFPITPTLQDPNAELGNYTVSSADGTLTVTPAQLTVAADAKTKVFGAPLPALTASFSGFVLGEGPGVLGGTLTLTTAATASSPVGSFAIVPGGLTSSNYALGLVDGTLTVTPASTTVILLSNLNPADQGQLVSFTAAVSAVPPGAGTPTGVVTFNDGVSTLGATAVDAFGQAVLATSLLGVDTHAITAAYSGDSNFNGSISPSITQTINNVVPEVSITTPTEGDLFTVGSTVNLSASFTDPGLTDTHTCTIDWDDLTDPVVGAVTEADGSGVCVDSRVIAQPGVYGTEVTITDNHGGAGEADVLIVVYDPDGGFVTGGGWIESPLGAYVPDPVLTGKAVFGFVSKYRNGANVPTGNTEFQFKVADLNFRSEVYEWLVVAGPRGQFKGTGEINGEGNYGFMLTAIDGAVNGGGGADKFRIKIWDKENGDGVVYDNNIGAADNADPATTLGGGSIVIHNEGNGNRGGNGNN